MKTASKLALSLLSVLLLANPAPAEILLQSFEDDAYAPTFFYLNNTWVTSAELEGFTITGSADLASEDGMGQNIDVLDISSMTQLSLSLRLNPGNTATRLQVILRNQGTNDTHTYQYDLTEFTEDVFTTVTLSLAAPLVTAGSGVDFSALDRIQIQGTSNNTAGTNFDVTLQSVTAIPEPSSLLLMMGGLVSTLVLSRLQWF